MRNALPLAGLGCFTVIILGVIIGGIVMISHGVGDLFDEKENKENKQTKAPPTFQPGPDPGPRESKTLFEARSVFATVRINSNYARKENPLPEIVGARTVNYQTKPISLFGMMSILPKKGPKQPLVIWVHDGFGGVTAEDWHRTKPFRDAGCAVMIPAFREENADNQGEFEMFYGELDDLFAAIQYGASQPGIDTNRVYVAGTGTGGTLTLLGAVFGRQRPAVRAWFAIGGTPFLEESLKAEGSQVASVSPPFDRNRQGELRLRSALPFAAAIRQPTYHFSSITIDRVGSAQSGRMLRIALTNPKPAPFHSYEIAQATRDYFEKPLTEVISRKIELDAAGKGSAFQMDHTEVFAPFKDKK